MKTTTLLIEIFLDDHVTRVDVSLRRLLVDTIEYRDLGDVIEETSSSQMLELIVEVTKKNVDEEIKSLLINLGFDHFKIHVIDIE